MNSPLDVAFHGLQLGVVRAASLLTPAGERAEWRSEWLGELWQVRFACIPEGGFSWGAQREVTAFCLGSVQDAWCLRRHAWRSGTSGIPVHGSAAQCVLWLATVLGICAVIAQLLPGVNAEKESARYHVKPGVILIRDADVGNNATPTISHELFRRSRAVRQRYFDELAFYRIQRETLSFGLMHLDGWRVAYATPNIFELLGLPIEAVPAGSMWDRDLPSAILSHEVWTRRFASSPLVLGQAIRIGNRMARIAGVAPFGSWRLPGKPDVWLLQRDARLDAAPALPGYMLGHLTPLGQESMFGTYVPITAYRSEENQLDLVGVSVTESVAGPVNIYLFGLLLAFLSLPAVTSVTMSESSFSSHRPSWTKRVIRIAFMAAKLGIVAGTGYFAAVDLAYWNALGYSQAAEFLQLSLSFSICLFGFRWAVLDQRQRCPVCLRRVTHPARVGVASQTFLGWNGTEMMCAGGHTLLHVPALPTSWFGGQRWMYLDGSWEFLFASSGM